MTNNRRQSTRPEAHFDARLCLSARLLSAQAPTYNVRRLFTGLLVIAFFASVPVTAQETGTAQTPQPAVGLNASRALSTRLLMHLTPVRSSDLPTGSRITITADGPLNKYQSYRSDDIFYIVIPQADAALARNSSVRGQGFTDAEVQQRGHVVMLLFRLLRETTTSVNQRFHRLDVLFVKSGKTTRHQSSTPAKKDESSQLTESQLIPCETTSNSPPLSRWRWIPQSHISIYFTLGAFKESHKPALIRAIENWNSALRGTALGITLSYEGDVANDFQCDNCMKVTRDNPVSTKDGIGEFRPIKQDRLEYITAAEIAIDPKITWTEELTSLLSHEIGHGLGLRDCYLCRRESTVMNQKKSWKNIASKPTRCDIVQLSEGYSMLPQ